MIFQQRRLFSRRNKEEFNPPEVMVKNRILPTNLLSTTFVLPINFLSTMFVLPTNLLSTTFVLPTNLLSTMFVLPTNLLSTTFVLPTNLLSTTFVLPTNFFTAEICYRRKSLPKKILTDKFYPQIFQLKNYYRQKISSDKGTFLLWSSSLSCRFHYTVDIFELSRTKREAQLLERKKKK